MNSAAYVKTMKNVRYTVDVPSDKQRKRLFEMDIKTKLCSTKKFNNNNNGIIAVRKIKTTLTVNKSAHAGMCILELSKITMYEFHDQGLIELFKTRS